MIPKQPFYRVVREIALQHADYRMQSEALKALQEAAEAHLTRMFAGKFITTSGFALLMLLAANHCAIYAKRVIVMKSDIGLLRNIGRKINVDIV